MNAKKKEKLIRTLKSGPLTRTVKGSLAGNGIADIHSAAAELGYTRRAVNHALRHNGVRQNKSRKDKE